MKTGILWSGLALALAFQTTNSFGQVNTAKAAAGQDAKRFRIEMIDKTVVFGKPIIDRIELDLGFDQVSIPIRNIRSVKLISSSVVDKNLNVIVSNDPTGRFIVELTNSDRLSGQIRNQPFVVEFVAGKVTLPFGELKAMQASNAEMPDGAINSGGPVFHFDFEGKSKSIAKNRVANKHHLQLNGAARIVKSKIRRGIKLDGSKSMTVPHSQELCPQKFTLAAWIKPTGNRDNYAFIVGKSNSSTWDGGFGLVYMSSDPTHVHFYVNGYKNQIVKAVVKSDTWSHLTGTCDGKSVVLYLNGKEIQRTVYPKGQPVQHASGPLSIGGDPSAYYWTGEIDEIAMFSNALSPAQVKELYNRHILP